ncbi:hypothetical protein SteCoe_7798 [Stentor coeruleus]|uniref:Uncharacterized protein n=1 Tax=Stentor coeruleus TaxID=5963 RepID=A0A1R2CLP4_9CILI|nr:hypothetical protein SteCoe_7798 [Stentor coeruleus]
MYNPGVPNAQYNFENVVQRPPPSSYMRQQPSSKGGIPTGSRAGGAPQERPVTSNRGAGFPSSSSGKKGFESKPGSSINTNTQKPSEEPPEIQFKKLEKEISLLLNKSAETKLEGNFSGSLSLAKEAVSKEKKLRNLKEDAGAADQINIDLTYAACVNLGIQYQANGMFEEALNTYSLVVRNKDYPLSGRLRVNMGNIYHTQEKYSSAIKMYRMALDQMQNIGKHMKFQIMRNIANGFVKMGQFHEAIENYENIMQGEPDHRAAYNLIICYYALGDTEKMKKTFIMLLSIEIIGTQDDDEEDGDNKGPNDPLSEYIKEKRREAFKYIIDAAKLIAPIIEKDWIIGYEAIAEALRNSEYSVLESEIGILKAEQYIKIKDYDKAIEVFKSFEKKDQSLMARAATNISFLYFIEKDYKNAEKYSDIAIKTDRYNAKALVNKGNCLYIRGEYETSKEFFLEAIGVEADCVEAIYNLGLVNRKMEVDLEALQAFEKLQTIMANAPEVMFQIASIYENARNFKQAIKWYNLLLTALPTDPGVLQKIGFLYSQLNDENQAFHYYMESYRHLPINIEAISWLGVFYVKSELYEKACSFFERASQIQYSEPKWKIMVASCYRRMGNDNKAIDLYKKIHEDFPDNIDCLQYLVSHLKGTGQDYENYSTLLKKLLREKEMNEPLNDANQNPPPPVMQQMPMPAVVESAPKEVNQRPGTSRKGGKTLATKADEDWNLQDNYLP